MIINLSLQRKSIKEAIKKLQELKVIVNEKLIPIYLKRCAEWTIEKANANLDAIPIDSRIKSIIKSNWNVSQNGNNLLISNTAQTETGKNVAVFVEFGVGQIGEQNPHPSASQSNYQYNIKTNSKRASEKHDNPNTWRFYVDEKKGVDLQAGYYEEYQTRSGRTKIVTTGSPASLFLYQAMQEGKSSGEYAKIWEEAKKQIIK